LLAGWLNINPNSGCEREVRRELFNIRATSEKPGEVA
jgi:hypothetical protein